jgi:UDP-2,3-diacylglucosamine pyrophosphatase LpxH
MKKSIISKMSIDAKVAEGIEKYKKKVRAEETKREKEYTKNIEKLQKQLTDARGAKPINLIKPSKTMGDYTLRIIIPDLHGVKMHSGAIGAFFNDLKTMKIPPGSEIVQLGDLMDCGGCLAEHHTLGYVQDINETSYEADIIAGNNFLNELQKITKGYKIHILEGNHEERVEKWCVKQGMGNRENAQGFLDRNGPEAVLRLKDRGIKYYRRSVYHNTKIKGMLRLGKCNFIHGMSFATHASKVHADKVGDNIVFGHVHREMSYRANNSYGTYGAWSPGCLCDLQPCWAMPKMGITNHVHGYGLQIVGRNGNFLHFNIPIINNNSLLGHLL